VSLVLSPSQTSGPMYGFALLFDGCEQAVAPGSPGAVLVEGSVIDADDKPIDLPHTFVEVWNHDLLARSRADADGVFRVLVRKPPEGRTPEGDPLAPALNVTIFGVGILKQMQTRMYFPDESVRNAQDAILARVPADRRHTLVAQAATDGSLRFDVHVRGANETVFFSF
jgi:protocatechuate 3,4-dioxygenase alpha subunit